MIKEKLELTCRLQAAIDRANDQSNAVGEMFVSTLSAFLALLDDASVKNALENICIESDDFKGKIQRFYESIIVVSTKDIAAMKAAKIARIRTELEKAEAE